MRCRKVKMLFLNGLIFIAPIFLTVYILIFIIKKVDLAINSVLPFKIPGLGFAVAIFLVYIAGLVGSYYLGKCIQNSIEYVVKKLPGVRILYFSIKNLLETIKDVGVNREILKGKPVLVNYPHEKSWAVGFITGNLNEDEVFIFIPNSPNLLSGRTLIVNKKMLREINLNDEEIIKVLLTGGLADLHHDHEDF